jgi:REP element-mobilizing transposase RayT
MSSKYKHGDSSLPHFITFTIVGWIDIFTRDIYKDIFVSSLQYCIEKKGLHLHAWVIMSNHVHLIVSSENNISDFVRDIKKFTCKKLIRTLINNHRESRKNWMVNMFDYAGKNNNDNVYYQLWKNDYHPIMLYNPRRLKIAMNYLHNNPVKAGFVWEPWHYKYSSGIDYYTNEKGLIKIEKLI